MKFNPFRPNGMASPGMFSGRREELETVERCLFQTKHGNPQHFLIEGERGIGKSSLLLFVDLLASGGVEGISGENFRFLVVLADLGKCQTFFDVVRSVGVALRVALAKEEKLREAAKTVWEFLTNWEALGVKFKKDRPEEDEAMLIDGLVSSIVDVLARAGNSLDGVAILIDEADAPSEEAGLGSFTKLFSERLARTQCNRCVVGLAGLPSLLPKLRASHESSPRVFETMSLKPLEVSERWEVVERGLGEANRKNPNTTNVTDEAFDLLAHLSEGYPHFIQQFSYCAFEEDNDDIIDAADVVNGAFKENGALAQLGHKYFSKMYFHQINSDNYRTVLNVMAKHGDEWSSRQDILAQARISDSNVNNALKALKEREIIIQDENRRGFYRLPTRSFAAWINAINSVEERKGAPEQFSITLEGDL